MSSSRISSLTSRFLPFAQHLDMAVHIRLERSASEVEIRSLLNSLSSCAPRPNVSWQFLPPPRSLGVTPNSPSHPVDQFRLALPPESILWISPLPPSVRALAIYGLLLGPVVLPASLTVSCCCCTRSGPETLAWNSHCLAAHDPGS